MVSTTQASGCSPQRGGAWRGCQAWWACFQTCGVRNWARAAPKARAGDACVISRSSQVVAGNHNHSGGGRLFQLRRLRGWTRGARDRWGRKAAQVTGAHKTPVKNQQHLVTALGGAVRGGAGGGAGAPGDDRAGVLVILVPRPRRRRPGWLISASPGIGGNGQGLCGILGARQAGNAARSSNKDTD